MNDNLQELLGETLNETLRRNIKGVWNYLTTEKGLNPRNAAAIMGNVWLESRFLPDRVSSAGATGYMLFLGLREKDYQLWLKNNKHHPEYGLFDYILYAILDPEHKHDFYRNDYERVKKGMDLFKKLGKTKEYNEYNKYKNSVYGSREREGKLHFFSEVNDAFNNPDYKLDDLTTLWHDSIERSNPNEARLDNRKTAANSFLKYFYKPQATSTNLISPFLKILNNKYSTKPLFKKGGKAFVDGVNVLDSNPKAYKYVKKKYKMLNKGGLISKAQEGTKFQNLIGNVSNFLKSDSGLSMISGVSQLFKTFKSSSDLAKQQEELNKWKKAYVNSIVPEDAGLQVEQEEVLAKQANPDYNSSPIYKAWRLNQLELDSIQAAKQKAAQQADMYILNKLLEQLELNNEFLKNGMEDLFNKGLGMLSLYIGNNNTAPSVVTPIKDYAKEFKKNTNPSINNSNFKVAMAMKDPTYRLPNYTLPSISDYKFSWNK